MMTKPTQEEIEAAKEGCTYKAIISATCTGGRWDIKQSTVFCYDPKHNDIIATALEAYKPVDVEGLKKEIYDYGRVDIGTKDIIIGRNMEARIYNQAIDHLVEKGIINGK